MLNFPSREERNQFLILLLIFSAFAVLIAITDRVPIHLEEKNPSLTLTSNNLLYLEGVRNGTLSGPYAYRVLIPFTISEIHRLLPSVSIINIDYGLKIMFLIAAQFSFYFYLRIFFQPIISVAGVLMMDIVVAFTLSPIIGPSITETTDILNLTVYALAFIAIYKNSFVILIGLLCIGTFNRETTLLVLPLIFFNDYILKRKIHRSIIATIAVAIPYLGLRTIIRPTTVQWFTFDGLVRNIPFLSHDNTIKAIAANFHVGILLFPLLFLSFLRFDKQPEFLRRSMIITPFFIAVHYTFGTIIETRLWMPLFIIMIPLTMNTLIHYFGKISDYQQV